MFGLGLGEFLILFVIAIVFIKPEDIPGVFRKLGDGYRNIHRTVYQLLDELQWHSSDK